MPRNTLVEVRSNAIAARVQPEIHRLPQIIAHNTGGCTVYIRFRVSSEIQIPKGTLQVLLIILLLLNQPPHNCYESG